MTDPLALAKRAQARATAAESKAREARVERDAAVVAASRSGLRPASIADATGIDVWLVRKIIRNGPTTEET
jgi:hypothetical protein